MDQEELRSLLTYDRKTGVFTWKTGRMKGKRAGCIRGDHWIVVIKKRVYPSSRLAWLYEYGEWPPRVLRFNDGHADNVRIANLRLSIPNEDRRKDEEAKRHYKRELWARADKLTHELLLDFLHYDPETGEFTWRSSGSGRVKGQPAGTIITGGYRLIHILGKHYPAVKLAWFYVHGEMPAGIVKPKNENGLDCRLANLRLARTMSENNRLALERRPEMNRVANLKKFGLTMADYQAMLAAQNGVCAVCRKPETVARNGEVRWLCVDHCHNSNCVRQLLCVGCNTAIGYVKDDPARLRAAADYLERHAGNIVPMRKESA